MMFRKSLCGVVFGLLVCGQASCTEHMLNLVNVESADFIIKVKFNDTPEDVVKVDNLPTVSGTDAQLETFKQEQKKKALEFYETFCKPLDDRYSHFTAVHDLNLEFSVKRIIAVCRYVMQNIVEPLESFQFGMYRFDEIPICLVEEAKNGNDDCKRGLQKIYVNTCVTLYLLGIYNKLGMVTSVNVNREWGDISETLLLQYRVTTDKTIEATYNSEYRTKPDWSKAVEVFSADEVRKMFGDMV